MKKINDVLTRYQLLIENDGYDIRFIEDDDRIISADEGKIDQVLYNFINNAVNYCGEDKLIRIRQVNKPDVVRIEVIDNGKRYIKRAFAAYFRQILS